jgi:hypothetical protein
MSLIHTNSTLKFDIKKGNVEFTQTESYKTGANDSSKDIFKGECPLDSDKLKEWTNSVVESWLDGTSIRPDAQVDTSDENE